MKKLIAIIMVLCMVLGFAACSDSEEDLAEEKVVFLQYITEIKQCESEALDSYYEGSDNDSRAAHADTALKNLRSLKSTIENKEWKTQKYQDLEKKLLDSISGLETGIKKLIEGYNSNDRTIFNEGRTIIKEYDNKLSDIEQSV
ncbi:MAG: hypothetical protein IKV86_07145 [Clostridia bacterium]|nr:hypothetical protein [Clostridia bacterium]